MNAKSLAQLVMLKQPIVKGMTNMKSLTPKELARDLVAHYAKFDNTIRQYTIHYDDLNDFDQQQLAGLIMGSDDSYASESTGPDNPAYDKKMLPALLRFLKNTTDRDEEIEFVKEWRDGVTSYFRNCMEELLDDACLEYNGDRGLLYAEEDPVVRDKPDRQVNIWS
jgi:hypothetical protein